ncbi:MAG: lipopolysaccharide biosynthesis protein [Chloroflexi bacterium]|nr:lipopolysaccharide biosynthesis protein [Chloroflexota bacterium]
MAKQPETIVQSAARNTLWSYAATYGGKILIFITTVILAYFVTKAEYGLVGMGLTVIAFLEVMQDLGIGSAVIYREGEDAANTAFWLGCGIALTLFCITWLAAPLVATYFLQNNPNVIPIIRALGLSFPLFAMRNIHDALLRKRMQFKKRFIPDLIQVSSKGAISIGCALAGMGAWSLVWGQLGGSACGVIAYWMVNPWRPSFKLDRTVIKPLLSFGSNIVAVNGLSVVLAQTDYLLVGRYLGDENLGVYTNGFRFPDLMVMQVCVALANVLYPLYSRLRDDPAGLQQGFFIASRYVALVTVPLSLGIAITAEPFVLTLLSVKWIETVPIMRTIAIYTLFLSLGYNVGDVYKAQNRTSILTKLSIARLIVLVPALWFAAAQFKSLQAVGITHAIVAFLGSTLNLVVAAKVLNMPIRRILSAFQPAIIAGTVMSICLILTLLALQNTPAWLQLLAAVVVGIGSYAGTLWFGQREVLTQAGQTLRGAVARR